jgi:methylmalonyl-CoA/ethylmalonyl-CoA epimerase
LSMESARAKRIDHVAVAVEDLDEAVGLFTRLLGQEPYRLGESEQFRVRVAIFELGDVNLELLEGTDPGSPVASFIRKRGPGIHHICYEVEDLKATLERLGNEGFEILGSGDEIGVEGSPVAFVHPGSTGGVLTEFIEGTERDTD